MFTTIQEYRARTHDLQDGLICHALCLANESDRLSRMKISYDCEVDALSIMFRETTVTTQSLGEGIAAEYDSEGRLAGLEILDAMRRFGGADMLRQVTFEGLGPAARV